MLVSDATLADGREVDVRVEGESIAAVGTQLSAGDEPVVDAAGKLLLPGAIDVHVHFRQPGFDHKETWASGSRSAAAGGVTTVVDQPNTDPPTATGAAFDEKAALAADSLVDYGINGGVVDDWDPDSLFDRPLFALGEVFLADSTGDMGIDEGLFRAAAERAAAERVVVTVHAEDADLFHESALDRADDGDGGPTARDADPWSDYRSPEAEAVAVQRAVAAAEAVGADLHVAHTSTPAGVRLAARGGATCEVTPHHLLLSREDAAALGTFGRMNPPLRSETRRRELFDLLADGTVDVVATDHAPHTRAEKDAPLRAAPSGVPGVETMLPLLLQQARNGRLTYERVRDVTARNPARIFDLPAKGRVEPGADADLVLVDPDESRDIRGETLHSTCDWTPFEGMQGVFPEWTMVRGRVVFRREGVTDVEDAMGELEATASGDAFGDPAGRNVRR